jgi:8-oxo-dGTP pyrophosphatase MutT (NUDIX family)
VTLDPAFIRARLAKTDANAPADSRSTTLQAAVLVLIYPTARGLVTLLTLRSDELPHHAGQISFPGGRVQHGDENLEATALRETIEETGLDPAGLELLGRLPVTVAVTSGFAITPIVAWLDFEPRFQPDTREVAALIECPLECALNLDSYRTGRIERDGVTRDFWYLDVDGHHVWGATARILRSLALVLA